MAVAFSFFSLSFYIIIKGRGGGTSKSDSFRSNLAGSRPVILAFEWRDIIRGLTECLTEFLSDCLSSWLADCLGNG